jgi:hypothetical protein
VRVDKSNAETHADADRMNDAALLGRAIRSGDLVILDEGDKLAQLYLKVGDLLTLTLTLTLTPNPNPNPNP